MKKLILLIFVLPVISMADNCQILSQMMNECSVNPARSCFTTSEALKTALTQVQMPISWQKKLIEACYLYCKHPEMFNKSNFLKSCYNISK